MAQVDRWCVGDYAVRSESLSAPRIGHALRPNAKSGHLYAVRHFFRDYQEWEWITRRWDPARALATPRSIKALIGPDPRVIDDKIWAKLMWAGLNVNAEDFPIGRRGAFYPVELLRALTLTWLFAGLRCDEISRLRVGCIRWQLDNVGVSDGGQANRDSVCLLDVPTNKTDAAFTKPVEPFVGQAIAAWEGIRPGQPQFHDRRSGAPFDALFSHRGQRVGHSYINDAIIPTLCRKAGVPVADARGRITSHRARSTIASQLYNAKDPMTLFELQAWLGHRCPSSTQHYARITPVTLAKAYHDAGYFARNVGAIEVLVDRDAIQSGAAASGKPWQHFDLGHGYCTYNFFALAPWSARQDWTLSFAARALWVDVAILALNLANAFCNVGNGQWQQVGTGTPLTASPAPGLVLFAVGLAAMLLATTRISWPTAVWRPFTSAGSSRSQPGFVSGAS